MKKTTTYDLVKSLTKSEKRYFKLFSNMQNRSKGNILLFDLLDKMDVYDEQRLIKKLKKNTTINNLSIAKKQLYDKLMQALRAYQKAKSPNEEVLLILTDLEILYGKRQYETCRDLIKKGLAITEEYDMFVEDVLFQEWSKKRGIVDEVERYSLDYTMKTYSAVKDAQNRLDNYNEYWKLGHLLLSYINTYLETRSEQDAQKLNQLLEEPFLKDTSNALSPRVLNYCYSILTYYYRYFDGDKFLEITETGFKHLTKHPFLIHFRLEGYLIKAHNLLIVYWISGRFKDGNLLLQELENVEVIHGVKLNKHEHVYRQELIYCYRLLINFRLGQLDSLDALEQIELFLNEKKEIALSNRNEIAYTLALYHFIHLDYRKVNLYISDIIKNAQKTRKYSETAILARLLNLMVQYELENYDVGLNLLRRQDYYYKGNTKYEFETVILTFFKKIFLMIRNSKEEKTLLLELQQKIGSTLLNNDDKFYYRWLHIDVWVASKIEKTPLKSFLKKQYSEW